MPAMCRASCVSIFSSTLSKIRYTRSKRDRSGGGRSMFFVTGRFGLYLDSIGLAEARMEVLALSVVIIPALAIEIVCCSITSCNTDRVDSDILSNSSMQHTPPSERTSAPLSRTSCLVSMSLVTYAVRPTADEPFPDV
ncbi:hypothetical protein OGATHE_003891 [Ogataea polymorpha]|uniref:Uncharacterized protein n=1 Tax=Ogataea polymorpha TaxID=460523 RepID=A0A9P8T4P5_9ASCO|nr:hypothetical protein OGATHE_003891 [Ogataea polymorpha]